MIPDVEDRPDQPVVPLVSVPEIRDFGRINAELVRLLDLGHSRVRVVGADGQRLLVAGLRGSWRAVVEVEGSAGPELAAALAAPGLVVVCRGPVADGAASGLRAGRVVIEGEAGDALGYAQDGGTIVVTRSAGARAGLNQRGGVLVILGPVGRLAGERQSGGRLFAFADRLGPHAGRGRRGGAFVRIAGGGDATDGMSPEDRALWSTVRREVDSILGPVGAPPP